MRVGVVIWLGSIRLNDNSRPFGMQSGIRLWHILTGSAQAALGNYDGALEHLRKVKDEMERLPLMDDWYLSLPLQAAFVEPLARQGGSDTSARCGRAFSKRGPGDGGARVSTAGLGSGRAPCDCRRGVCARGVYCESLIDGRGLRSPAGCLASSWDRRRDSRTRRNSRFGCQAPSSRPRKNHEPGELAGSRRSSSHDIPCRSTVSRLSIMPSGSVCNNGADTVHTVQVRVLTTFLEFRANLAGNLFLKRPHFSPCRAVPSRG